MEQNLVGYLLNALDDEAHREVEERLANDAEAREHAQLLEKSLAMLALDAETPQPPADLVVRTLGRVAEYAARQETSAKPPTVGVHALACAKNENTLKRELQPTLKFERPTRSGNLALPLSFLARADVLAAACFLAAAIGVGISWMYHLATLHDRTVCLNSLKEIYTGLDAYQQVNGHFPNVNTLATPPRNVSGLVVPMLVSQGHLPPDFTITCPMMGKSAAPIKFEEAMNLAPDKFEKEAAHFTPGLGYSLGYRHTNGTIKPHNAGNTYLAVMADAPPEESSTGNSPNHGGTGQNVLFADGHSKFTTSRNVGFKGDDIYLNKFNKRQAGADPQDSVIGHGWSKP